MQRNPFHGVLTPESEAPVRSFVDQWTPRWVTPNAISWLRIAAIPGILALMACGQWGTALITFILAMLLDFVDGPLARARGLVTPLGKILDPIADKCGILLPFWAWWLLAEPSGVIPSLLVGAMALLTALEVVLVLIRSVWMRLLLGHIVAHANPAGKVKVWVEGFLVGFLLYEPHELLTQGIATMLALVAIVLAGLSILFHRAVREA